MTLLSDEMVKRSVPGKVEPSIVTFMPTPLIVVPSSVSSNVPSVRKIVAPVMLGSNRISSGPKLALAMAMASRSEQSPSLQLPSNSSARVSTSASTTL